MSRNYRGTVEPGSDLEKAAEKLFNAAYEYREFLKRHHKEMLAGVIWVRRDRELIAYSENERYTNQVCQLTHEGVGDSFSIIDVERPEE